MIGMSTILAIKQRLAAGESVAAVARAEGISEPTVRKYRDADDFSPVHRKRSPRESKLDPYKPTIDGWLAEDRRRRRKQRHSAKRIYDRLVSECGFDGGYTIVQTYVKARKAELKCADDEFLKLIWAPAEAQVDFGTCDFRVRGVVREVHYLVVTFPFSNVSLAQCFRGETSECVCEGLKSVFGFIGGVPLRLVFDNATGVGRRVGEAIRTADVFERFAAHYGFEFSFCNANAGHEKGAVENAVGAIRRNLFVPMPRVDNLAAYNARLLGKCLERADKDHYAKGEPERQLFAEDCAALIELPPKPFRAVRIDAIKADKYGDVCIEGNHRYPLGPEFAEKRVIAEFGAFDMSFYDGEGTLAATYPRAYGSEPTRADNPAAQLGLLARKPGAWRNSEVRASIPASLSGAIDRLDKESRAGALRILRDVSATAGYEAAVSAMTALAETGRTISEADVALSASLIANGQGTIEYDDAPDLSRYDAVFGRRSA